MRKICCLVTKPFWQSPAKLNSWSWKCNKVYSLKIFLWKKNHHLFSLNVNKVWRFFKDFFLEEENSASGSFSMIDTRFYFNRFFVYIYKVCVLSWAFFLNREIKSKSWGRFRREGNFSKSFDLIEYKHWCISQNSKENRTISIISSFMYNKKTCI